MTCLWYTSINNKFSIMIIKRRKNNEKQWLDWKRRRREDREK